MLPILHPLEKTKVELRRGVIRLELHAKTHDDEKSIQVLEHLKKALEVIESE